MVGIDFQSYKLVNLNDEIVDEISSWRYESPYDVYDLYKNNYLTQRNSWGVEQFALASGDDIVAYVSCQIAECDMWVGWSLRPNLCDKSIGESFVEECVEKLTQIKNHHKRDIFLKVYSWNTRAIKVYERVGFVPYDKFERLEDGNANEYIVMRMNAR